MHHLVQNEQLRHSPNAAAVYQKSQRQAQTMTLLVYLEQEDLLVCS